MKKKNEMKRTEEKNRSAFLFLVFYNRFSLFLALLPLARGPELLEDGERRNAGDEK